MINQKILKYLFGFLAIFALISIASAATTENFKENLINENATKTTTETVTTDAVLTQEGAEEEVTRPKPPMVQYIEEVFTGIQNILGNVAEIVKSSFGSIGRQSDNTVHPRNK